MTVRNGAEKYAHDVSEEGVLIRNVLKVEVPVKARRRGFRY